ncbi:MAG: GNAT family N-acetyltransferase [Prevotellaceae bacterium]|jgi:ribosomal protein S18 acetylase RimI-like enzyme|nr:GNAT family N-acetyltransferase [Prevotellaceae bacterium]
MNKLLIEKIQNSEFEEVAGILTDAFITNPAYSIIFTGKNQQREGLLWLFKTSLFMLNQNRVLTSVIKEKTAGTIIGTFTLIPPQGIKRGISVYFKTGIPRFILKFGIKALFRMLRLDGINKNTLKEAMQTSEYYLSMVAIIKEYRGKGIGSHAIKSAIQALVSSGTACGLLGLTTQLPENKTFYSRLGFTTLDEGYISFKGDKYYNYNMKLNFTDIPQQVE